MSFGVTKDNIVINFQSNSRVSPKKQKDREVRGYELESLVND